MCAFLQQQIAKQGLYVWSPDVQSCTCTSYKMHRLLWSIRPSVVRPSSFDFPLQSLASVVFHDELFTEQDAKYVIGQCVGMLTCTNSELYRQINGRMSHRR